MSPNEGTAWTALRDAIPVFNGTNPAITKEWIDEVEGLFAPVVIGSRASIGLGCISKPLVADEQ